MGSSTWQNKPEAGRGVQRLFFFFFFFSFFFCFTFTSREQKFLSDGPLSPQRAGEAQRLSAGQRNAVTARMTAHFAATQEPCSEHFVPRSWINNNNNNNNNKVHLTDTAGWATRVAVMLQPPSSLEFKPWRDDRLGELIGKWVFWVFCQQVGKLSDVLFRASFIQTGKYQVLSLLLLFVHLSFSFPLEIFKCFFYKC